MFEFKNYVVSYKCNCNITLQLHVYKHKCKCIFHDLITISKLLVFF